MIFFRNFQWIIFNVKLGHFYEQISIEIMNGNFPAIIRNIQKLRPVIFLVAWDTKIRPQASHYLLLEIWVQALSLPRSKDSGAFKDEKLLCSEGKYRRRKSSSPRNKKYSRLWSTYKINHILYLNVISFFSRQEILARVKEYKKQG